MKIEFIDLTYRYQKHLFKKTEYGVRNLTLTVEEGEAFGFLGGNGAGKTTSIKCLMGLQIPTKGEVKIDGKNSLDPTSRNRVGFLPEFPYFYQHLSVVELLKFYSSLLPKHKCNIEELLSLLSLSERRNDRLKNLSKGLAQRVGLAQSLLGNPRLLVLDEPFSGLDPIGRKEFRDVFLDQKKKGTTIFMSSHILNDIEAICDRASILVRGELKQVVSLAERRSIKQVEVRAKKAGEERSQLYMCSSIEEANVLAKDILGKDGIVESVTPEYENLEDIFVTVTNEAIS